MHLRWLPEGVKKRLRPLPQWSAVGVEPRERIRVDLCTAAGRFDVTANQVIAALVPFTVAIGLERRFSTGDAGLQAGDLQFVDIHSERTIGWLRLARVAQPALASADIGFFRVERQRQRCVRWPYRTWNRWLGERAARRHKLPGNLSMGDSLQSIMIFYILPRPVVLVSVDDGQHSNLFPMDLIGTLGTSRFALALRTSSRSVATMQHTRRVVLSSLAECDATTAYALGAHHRQPVVWDRLPFELGRSATFGLPTLSAALRVRELELEEHAVIGSHTFFVGRVVTDTASRNGVALCHASGLYQHFSTRRRRPLPLAR